MSAPALLLMMALSAPPNFNPASQQWNGLSYLKQTAQEAKIDIDLVTHINWSNKTDADVIVFINPTEAVSVSDLLDFVYDGGRAVVALDRGGSDATVVPFGIKLLQEPVLHGDYYRDQPPFPRLTKSEDHFLWFNIDHIILNHPAALAIHDRPQSLAEPKVIIPFAEPEQAFAIESSFGSGMLLAISDASVFINDMQQGAYGDKQLVANLLRRFGDARSVTIVLPGADGVGRYRPSQGQGIQSLEHMFARAVSELNTLVAMAHHYLERPEVMRAITLGLAALAMLICVLLPWPRQLERYRWQSRASAQPSQIDYRARALSFARQKADFGVAALSLERKFMRGLANVLPTVANVDVNIADERRKMAGAVGRCTTTETGALALSCLETFHVIRRAHGPPPRPVAPLGLAEFDRLWNDCDQVMGVMNCRE